jgi:hypothetical protein
MSACWECGGPPPLHDHHVVPRSRGGTRTVPLCEPCHGLVHGRQMRTSDLTRAALAAKSRKGERTGRVPFGSQLAADGVHLIDNPREQAVIDGIRGLRAAGLSIRAIVATVNRECDAGRTIHKSLVERLIKEEPDR